MTELRGLWKKEEEEIVTEKPITPEEIFTPVRPAVTPIRKPTVGLWEITKQLPGAIMDVLGISEAIKEIRQISKSYLSKRCRMKKHTITLFA